MNITMANESDVEQKFIIQLLTNESPFGLGYGVSDYWTKPDIRGLSIDKGKSKKIYYPDYIIVLDSFPCFVIEAKRPGEDLGEALREARLYATELNSTFRHGLNPCIRVMATDGERIVASHADSEDIEIEISKAEIDPSLEPFDKLRTFLSKKDLQSQCALLLAKTKKNARYYKPVEMLGGKAVANQSIPQNTFGNNISIEYRHLFNPTDNFEKQKIVENAYVITRRKEKHIRPIDRIIKAAIPSSIIDAIPIKDTSNPTEITDQLKKVGTLKGSLCLLIGSVGSGKSTFTHYLENKAIDQNLRKNTSWHHVDLNNAPLNRDEIYKWVVSQILISMKKSAPDKDFDELSIVKDLYIKDLSSWEKTFGGLFSDNLPLKNEKLYEEIVRLTGDNEHTLKCLIEYLYTKNNTLPLIVLDNCDKGNKNDQLLMFEVANWLRDTYPFLVFLPIRDTTYDNFSNLPPLDTVIKDMVFRIDPPLLERVIKSRIDYLAREITSDDRSFEYLTSNGMKIQCKRKEVSAYMLCIVDSLFSNDFTKGLIKGLAGRNIRLGLQIVLDFCKSGHITEDDIFRIRTSGGNHKIHSTLIMRIILKGNKLYYSDENSIIKNLFYSEESDALPDPISRLSILHWLNAKRRIKGPNQIKGWHKTSELLRELQYSGHEESILKREIISLLESNLIENETQDCNFNELNLITITPVGTTHLDLIKHSNYLSAIAEDALFRENQPAKLISDNLAGTGIHKKDSKGARLSSSTILLKYLLEYNKNYIIKGQGYLERDQQSDITELENLYTRINIKSEQENMNQGVFAIADYPQGTVIEGSIGTIKEYGFFVNFDINLSGIVHRTNYGSIKKSDVETLEEGDIIEAEVITWQNNHNRFALKLIGIPDIR